MALLLLWFAATLGRAQGELCQGSLGENIFLSGDFGSGTANIVQNDPGIAPGYIYTTTVPFDDGIYTITNNTGDWPSIYPTWLEFEDNSPDPNGYMMVVNATFSPGIFYEQTVSGLCGNTLYEFSADVINIVKREVENHIFPNVSFLIDGEVKYSSGPIPQTEEWLTAGFTFRTDSAQTELTLTLRNNAPGGIGNDLAIDNITFRPCGPFVTVGSSEPDGVVCEDQGFPLLQVTIEGAASGVVQWQESLDSGATWQSIPGESGLELQVMPRPPGRYQYRVLYASTEDNLDNDKCRIASEIYFMRVVPIEFLIIDTLCQGLSFRLGDNEYSETGIYTDQFISSDGCDSIVTLDLVIVPDPGIQPDYFTEAPSCTGYDDGLIAITGINGGVDPYAIFLDGIDFSGQDSLYGYSGNHDLQISDRYGCAFEETVFIPAAEDFYLSGVGDTTVFLGYQVLLETFASDSVSDVSWSPSEYLSCSNCLSPVSRPFQDVEYTVSATSVKGCLAQRTVNVTVDRSIRSYMPNVFSPNFDGINDYWGVYPDAQGIDGIVRVVIYDRWGGVIFSDSDIPSEMADRLWDGKSGGLEAPAGVYTYAIQYLRPDGTTQYASGSITLLR